MGDLVDLIMEIGRSGLLFLGFILSLGGLLLLTSPNRYGLPLNQTLAPVNLAVPANFWPIVAVALLLTGAYILLKKR